jgi:cell wall-associated NlpC family hydrolase
MRTFLLATALAFSTASPALARQSAFTPTTVPPSGVIGVQDAYLSPDFWIARQRDADAVVMDRAAIDAQNARLMRIDPSMHDLAALPPALDRERVLQWIDDMSRRPDVPLFGQDGAPVAASALDAIVANANRDAVPDTQPTRYGLAVHRAALRTFPTATRVFSERGDTDIDRFQESALFPGTPVAIAHASRDGRWLFVVSPRYAAWVEKGAIAEGAKDAVLGYAAATPYRLVTGAKVRTVYTPEEPRVSELQLDMGVRVPLAASGATPVNGQQPYTSWPIRLPVRNADGSLTFATALLQKNTDTAAAPLPLTRANIIRQAFKFLGERYGWGHDYNARDCSGFVSEVYRSMGVLMPRNTSDQGVSPAFDRIHFEKTDGADRRMAAVDPLQVVDLVDIPGHVMMVIGRIDGVPYVIHDTNGGSYLGADGAMHGMHLNGVSVTPLTPLRFNPAQRYIDRMTNIVRMRPTGRAPQAAGTTTP